MVLVVEWASLPAFNDVRRNGQRCPFHKTILNIFYLEVFYLLSYTPNGNVNLCHDEERSILQNFDTYLKVNFSPALVCIRFKYFYSLNRY